MAEKLISADNHIDLTYCPPDLWSSVAPQEWREMVPRTEEREDGLHWIVDGQDKGVWNGVGPGFLKYQKGAFQHVDEMAAAGFDWNHHPGAVTRPTTPETRIADLDKDGVQAEIVYGCLMVNDMIANKEARAWANRTYNDWAIDFAHRADPNRVFPLAIIPNNSPEDAAAEVRRCAKMGIRGGDLAFKGMPVPLWHRDWYPVWEAAAECHFPISFHSTGFRGIRAPDTREMEKEYFTHFRMVRSSLFQLDTMEVLVSIITSGACEKYPDFKFILGESGVTWLPYLFDRMDTSYDDRARSLGLTMKPSDYFRRQGYVTYQQDAYLEPNVPLVGEDNIMWGSDYPHPDCLWPESRAMLEKNLAALSPTTRRKIVHDNVAKLYNINVS
ncbi:amidohydrolase family protein [Trinickia symbiotica]|uniref:amidohydrolase family protein n=1 Tax=Trinickia symbiotica TaxID=863227 RepID=UPI0003670060|nr:amidohydrolase family protein [Trinickia symbiotica]